MKNQVLRVMFIDVLLIGLLAALLVGCGAKQKEEENKTTKRKADDSVSVLVAKVETKELALTKIYTGSLEGEQQANVVSQLAERIVGIPVKVGSSVSAGQVVVRLDKGGVTSQYYQAQSNFKNTEKNYQRMKSLYESGAIALQALDGAETQFEIAKANFDAARSAVEITSPISGIVIAVQKEVGDFTQPGSPVITVARINSLKLVMSVGEADIPYIKEGQNVKILSELNAEQTVNGRITEIARSADQQTRTFEVKATFPNSKGNWFKPGMFAKAELELNTKGKEVALIPREAVIYSEQGPRVFVISDGKAKQRNVKLGLQNDKSVEVVEGLNQNEVVATVGINNLKDGSPVIVSNFDLLSKK